MVAMACETRHCRGRSSRRPFTRRHQRCRRHPGDGSARHDGVGRYYDPQTGQFISVDPMVQQTREPYSYGTDDPIARIDPIGAFDCPADATHYTGQEAKYNCVAIVKNVHGYNIWIREGARGAAFEIKHAEIHGINLAATKVALHYALLNSERAAYTDALEFFEYLPITDATPDLGDALYYAWFYVQDRDRVAPNSSNVAPDGHQIGLLTSFCRGYADTPLPQGGNCPPGTSETLINDQNPKNPGYVG